MLWSYYWWICWIKIRDVLHKKKIDSSESSTAKGVNIAEYKGVKVAEFPETSIEMKNCKTFYKVQTASRLRKFFSLTPPPIPPDKILLCLWSKNLPREIYRNIQIFAFQVLQDSSSFTLGNGEVQMFFLTPNRNMFAGKFVNRESFWLCFASILFSMSKELRFVK